MSKSISLRDLDVNRVIVDMEQDKIDREKNNHSKWKKGVVLHTKEIQNMSKEDTWNYFIQKGFIDNNKLMPVDYSKINNMLAGQPIAIIGSGFSGRGLNWDLLGNIKTLGINHIIDIYKGLDMLIFQDHRFNKKSTTDLSKFKGHVFVVNSNPVSSKMRTKKIIPFVPLHTKRHRALTTKLENGLYARKSTGLCAVHLALCLGCDPIYMIGLDNPKNWEDTFTDYEENGIHIKKEYTGSVNTKKALLGYLPVLKMYKTFLPFKDRIINVCKGGIMDWFKQISIYDFNRILESRNNKE